MRSVDGWMGVVTVTFPLGRFGDNHVTPDELFDVNDPAARPPRDAIDVQFRIPVTLNTVLHMMGETGNDAMLDDWRRLYTELAEGTKRYVQKCGYGVDVERRGLAPARLAITAVMHGQIAGFDQPRWHLHVYVGATATSIIDDRTVPVHVESLENGLVGMAQPYYTRTLESLTNQEWGVQWARHGEWLTDEVTAPDIVDFVESRDRGVCVHPELAAVAQVILPDLAGLKIAARSEAARAKARAEGRPIPGTYTRPLLADEVADSRA